ncbi:MAG: hypothetical protein JXN62_10320 [Bacteroidales bacterium]|nr:hypothetical protein [Bacteroidales bacterium]
MRLGKLKQATLLVIFLFFSGLVKGQPVIRQKVHFDGNLQAVKTTATASSVTINYSISDLDLESFTNDYGSFFRVIIPGHSHTSVPGKPEIPVLSSLITMPEGNDYRIRITDIKSTKIFPGRKKINGLLFPAQEGETKAQERKKPFAIDKTIYEARDLIQADTVTIESIGTLRGKKLACLLISPVRYNPHANLLEVITSMKIEIIFSASKASTPESNIFNSLLSKSLSNYYPSDLIPGYTDKPVRMVILTDTTFRKHLDPLIKWKTQKGFLLDILYRGNKYAGDDYVTIKNTLTNIYNSYTEDAPPPEYLLIIGDVSKIPYYGTSQVTDLYYGEFDGDGDYIPEMMIGRLPVKDTTELKSVLKKIIQYEKFEFADTNIFYSNSLATAGYDASYSSFMNGQVRYAVTNYLNPANNINGYHFYYPQTQPAHEDSVKKIINSGVSFVNYSGHGSSTSWLGLNIDTSDVRKLTNTNMYPFVISNACMTSKFDTSSLGNRMVVSKDKGAIGFIGCSNDSYWNEDFYWSVGVGTPSENPGFENTGPGAYDRLFHTHNEPASEWYYTMGQVNYSGNLAVSSSTSSRKKYYWETYNLVGDPSIIPLIGTPEEFNIALPDTLPETISSYSFTAEPFSYIAISNFDTLWDASFVSPSGSVTLEMPAVKGDSCLIVISGQNKIPVIKSIYFSEIDGTFVNLTKAEISDINGNNNGLADFGESLFLNLTLSNLGLSDLTNLSAKISSTSEWVTINTDYVYIGTLPAGDEIILNNNLAFTLANDIPDKGIITLDLILKDNSGEKLYKIDVMIHAPVLDVVSCVLDDSDTGNGNRVADPGETFKLVFRIRNNGSAGTGGILDLTSGDTGFTILEPGKNSGNLLAGETIEVPVLVNLSGFVSSGTTISVTALLNCDPYFVNRNFSFRVGHIRESFESSSFDLFPWINISPKPWTITESSSTDGIMAAKSGTIPHNSSSSLIIKTWYPEDDFIEFYYKVSSEQDCDFLIFRLNDKEIFRKSGETLWEPKSIPVQAGYNKLEWVYRKDMSIAGGGDFAMIDMIDFSQKGSVRYIQKDLVTGMIISPVQQESLGREPVTVKMLNLGPDTINGFNMAFRINDGIAVTQHFSDILYPSLDSVEITFYSRANVSHFGVYDLVVYSYDNNDENLFNDTLRVQIENNELDEPLLVFPNPFVDELKIVISSEAEGMARFILFNSAGKKIIDFEQPVYEGINEAIIRDNRLITSIYYLRVSFPGFSKTIPVIKIR